MGGDCQFLQWVTVVFGDTAAGKIFSESGQIAIDEGLGRRLEQKEQFISREVL
jgi:hypothetical protein